MLYPPPPHVLSIRLAFDNELKLNKSLATEYKMIVAKTIAANAKFNDLVTDAQKSVL
jgi:hypothetical protein